VPIVITILKVACVVSKAMNAFVKHDGKIRFVCAN
jgi:hypothetical protein